MSIQIVYDGTTFGPVSPTSLRTLLSALRIPPRSHPTLVGISDPSKAFSPTDLNVRVPPGLYECLCTTKVAWEEGIDSWPAPPPSTLAPKPQVHVAVKETEPVGEDRNAMPKAFVEGPMDDLEVGIEAMLHVISTIPGRYVKYNKILAAELDSALTQVDALSIALRATKRPRDERQASDTRTGVRIPSSSTDTENPRLPLETTRIFIQYRIFALLHAVWTSVWTRFGPRWRRYHVTDVRTPEALRVAERTLDRLHVWRRACSAQEWSALSREGTLASSGGGVTRLTRGRGYVPRRLELAPPSSGWEHLVAGDRRAVEIIREPQVPAVNVGEAVGSVRRMFVDTMVRTGLHRDEELNVLLREIAGLDAVARIAAAKDRNAGRPDPLYPTARVLNTLRREFGIRLEDDSRLDSTAIM
ncbi:hypothetical protein HKX48_007134 [Thoreauomyces humboldtii]|nr:hypothetical protein HKX48_007134 [Thoreauomyces humboldtii]